MNELSRGDVVAYEDLPGGAYYCRPWDNLDNPQRVHKKSTRSSRDALQKKQSDGSWRPQGMHARRSPRDAVKIVELPNVDPE